MSSAFPFQPLNTNGSPRIAAEAGLSKREYYAAAAMAALVARVDIVQGRESDWSVVASAAAIAADALTIALAARPQPKEPT